MIFRRQVTSLSGIFQQTRHPGKWIIETADRQRAKLFAIVFKIPFLLKIYRHCALRLGVSFCSIAFFSLTVSLFRPDLLLVFGPLVYGYAHLMASYRFTNPISQNEMSSKNSNKKFQFFCIGTLCVVIFHIYSNKIETEFQLPSNFWEIFIGSLVFLSMVFFFKKMRREIIPMVLIINLVSLRLAWVEPLIFVSAILFLHNWVAFAYWVYAAKDKSNKITAILATIIFAAIHLVVIGGLVDFLAMGYSEGSLVAANVEATSWALAPWSNDPVIWQRALILYTFGLSLHYFIWLKAIPENLQASSFPNSFRVTFRKMEREVGSKLLWLLLSISIVGTLVWIMSFSLGAKIYFSFSSLHIWLELMCLIALILNSYLSKLTRPRAL